MPSQGYSNVRRHFTPTQKKVAALLLQGHSTAEMCEELKMKPRTLKAHLNRMFNLYGIDDRYIKRVRLVYLIHKEQGALR